MFEQSLLENALRSGWKRALAVVISTTFQVALVMILIVMPLIFPESVPKMATVVETWIHLPQPPPQPIADRPPAHRPQGSSGLFHPLVDNTPRIEAPTAIPGKVDMTPDEMPSGDLPVNYAPAGNGYDTLAEVFRGLPGGPSGLPPRPQPRVKEPPAGPVRIGTLDPAQVVDRVQPIYPSLARQARIQGVVLLEAIISKTGRMERLRVLSGHPLLVQAALDAVNQWTYRPTKLNGEPVEVITTIEVRFMLSQ